jgi:hypothetical protein
MGCYLSGGFCPVPGIEIKYKYVANVMVFSSTIKTDCHNVLKFVENGVNYS